MNFWLVRILSIGAAVGFAWFLSVATVGAPTLLGPRLVALAGMYVTLAVSLNLINGITGQFSIGHAGFFQVGAYTAGILSGLYFKQGMDPLMWVGLMSIAGAVTAGIAGLLVGVPSLRLRGDYLAIVTLGFGEIIRIFVTTQQHPLINGATGINVRPQHNAVFLSVLLAIACIAVCRNLLQNAHGLPFLAIREDEVASNAMGINTTKYKVIAFVIGSAFAGAAGALFAHTESFILPDLFKMELSFLILTMVVLGGNGSITGSVVAALVLFYLPEVLRGGEGQATMAFSGPMIVGFFVGLIALVVGIRQSQQRHMSSQAAKFGFLAFTMGAAVLVGVIVSFLAKASPNLSAAKYDVNQLRMVIFSITLVFVMLVRPQGLLGHREFGWGLFSKKSTTPEVQA